MTDRLSTRRSRIAVLVAVAGVWTGITVGIYATSTFTDDEPLVVPLRLLASCVVAAVLVAIIGSLGIYAVWIGRAVADWVRDGES